MGAPGLDAQLGIFGEAREILLYIDRRVWINLPSTLERKGNLCKYLMKGSIRRSSDVITCMIGS